NNFYKNIRLTPGEDIEYDKYEIITRELQKLLKQIENKINEIKNKEFDISEPKENKIKSKDPNRFNYELNSLDTFFNNTYKFIDFINSPLVKLTNNPTLLLHGEAGIGKSHLLADITSKRIQENKLTLFLLGNYFVTDEDPWTQIFDHILRINISEDEFLGTLNSRAEAQGSRILIIIDAINEGRGIYFWKSHIRNFINKIQKYPFLGLIISYRSSYKKLLIPDSLNSENTINFITHFGFAHNEFDATKLFFANYDIEFPSTPLLHPEFSNPLFLKIFCEGISKADLHTVPKGFTGITQIINFFIKSINEHLASPHNLDYSLGINLVKRSIDIFIECVTQKKQNFLEYEEANILFEQELKKISNKNRLLDNLISEGIFNKNINYLSTGKYVEVIFLAYQRFEDHLTASYLLEKYLDKTNPQKSFSLGHPLFEYVKDESECNKNKGLVESFSIQIPELTNFEFYELVPSCKEFYSVTESFLESLIWRKADSIKSSSKTYLNEFILPYQNTLKRFFDILFLIAPIPEHPYNANSIHNYLMNYSLADRDSWWIPYIHDNFLYKESINRLVEWARSSDDTIFICEESRLLLGKILSWLLSSSNRYLRDNSSKAIISLFSNKIDLVIKLLKDFESVNDPYIIERLYGISYGCVLRSTNHSNLLELSKYVFDTIFNKDKIYPNILLRDYARGIIEYTSYLGIKIDFDITKIKPPYKSLFPTKFPTNEEIDQKYKFDYNDPDFKNYFWSQNSILSSMTTEYGRGTGGYGDFGRYTFESALRDWSDVNPDQLSNWAIEKIFELGYDVEKHGEFDRRQEHGRGSGHNERIGKKYQWIAFYEILARVSDNFKLKNPASRRENEYVKFSGPWEPYVRDFDPSTLLTITKKERFESITKNWWINNFPNDWALDHEKWLKSKNNLPDPKLYLKVSESNNVEWFNLVAYPQWEEPEAFGLDKSEYPHKELLYNFRCYLIPQKDLEILKSIVKNDINFLSNLDTYRSRYEVFSREYYWSPAYRHFNNYFYSGDFVQRIVYKNSNKSIRLIIPAEFHLWEEPYDCSKEDALAYYVPSTYLFNKMDMKFSKKDGIFINRNDEVICYDPSIYHNSLQCLLIRRNEFIQMLQKNNLTAVWLFWGEKRIISTFSKNQHLDRMEMKGMYYLENNEVQGSYKSFYIPHKLT
ncbi:MAG: ATP-binding protein, partial [Ignavibacteriae bacterium]|nr:ATP-binding protein [Ignavibacteriota bacterium]